MTILPILRPAGRRPLVEQYRLMWLIRVFEERAAELFQQGVIVGTAHSCVGQEAIAVGAAGVMKEGDYLVGHHRSHGHLIAAGADIRRMMAEMFGRRTGYCKGLGGSMHIADMSLNILGCNGIVGAGLPHACGAGLTAKLRSTGRATLAFFGDGAAGQGATHEAMNLAATWKLPVVFICENNQFALSADWQTLRAVADLADRARGYGMPGEVVDGNDVLAVEAAVADALELARAGDGPTFLEMKTFRRMQHSMRANLPDVRDPAVLAEWEPKDPLPRFEQLLRELNELDDERASEIRGQVEAEVETAIAAALADEPASPGDLLPAVFAPHRPHPAPPPAGDRALGFVAAIREALDQELDADPDVILMGEDIGRVGGIFRATEGLYETLRRRASPGHAADRERLRRLRGRRRAHRPPTRRGDPVLGFRRRRLRSDHEPGREAAVHDGRRSRLSRSYCGWSPAAACGSARSTRKASRRSSATSPASWSSCRRTRSTRKGCSPRRSRTTTR